MPRTIESTLANHDEARRRLATGRPVWDQKIPIGPIIRDESLTFEQTRDGVHGLLTSSPWVKDSAEFSDLRALVEELGDTETDQEFNAVLDFIYDHADADRVWLYG